MYCPVGMNVIRSPIKMLLISSNILGLLSSDFDGDSNHDNGNNCDDVKMNWLKK